MFTTGCHDTPTHWKQSVFYLHETLTVKEGEEITGALTCKPNGKNHRDLDFIIEYEFNGELSQSKQKNAYRMR
jgi:protein arginine N-methyltransferase 1